MKKKEEQTSKLRDMIKEEIEKGLQSAQSELRNLRFAKIKGEEKNPLKRRFLKRDIARILTIKKEKGWD